MAYSVGHVEKLLRNYLMIRSVLEGRGQQLHDNTVPVRPKVPEDEREKPLGMGSDGNWPFRETQHARVPRDGKAKARSIEELHCSILDIEEALKRLHDDDLGLLYRYHILQTHTLDELVAENGLTSRGSMQSRLFRIVTKLTKELERPKRGRP